jgi:hypothetical protein
MIEQTAPVEESVKQIAESFFYRPVELTRVKEGVSTFVYQVPVDRFSWIDRNNWETLVGEKETFDEYYHEHSANDLDLLSKHIFSSDEMRVVQEWFETGFKLLDRQQAFLAHGDFNCTHIFQSQ